MSAARFVMESVGEGFTAPRVWDSMGDNIRSPKLTCCVTIMVVASLSEENQYISLSLTKYFDGSNVQRKIANGIRSPRQRDTGTEKQV
jgi:hypothetical protein